MEIRKIKGRKRTRSDAIARLLLCINHTLYEATKRRSAIGLIFGVFSNLTYLMGTFFSIVIWTTAESFGGPYVAGSTDVGAAIIYVLVFAGLFLSQSGLIYGYDRQLTPRLGRWGWLASGGVPRP